MQGKKVKTGNIYNCQTNVRNEREWYDGRKAKNGSRIRTR
jgi:hypothetical protein